MNAKKILCSLAVSASIVFTGMTAQANVLDGAKQFNGHYYKVFETQLPSEDAKKFCKSMGGHLATSENFDENEVIQKLIDVGGKEEYLIGGEKNSQNIWCWVTGGVITDQNWAKGHPSYGPIMTMKKNGDSKWYTPSWWGSNPFPFVCEWDSAEQAHDPNL